MSSSPSSQTVVCPLEGVMLTPLAPLLLWRLIINRVWAFSVPSSSS